MSEYSVFKPRSGKSIFLDYPELRKFKEFSELKQLEMIFVWYYACESSPFRDIELEREKIQQCLDYSYLKDGRKKINKEDSERMLSGEFSAKITQAIERMLKFRVGPRVRAKMITEKIFDNIEKILDIDATDEDKHFLNKDGEVDFAKKKAYVDTAAKAGEILPKLISQLEGNFNLKEEKGKESAFEGESLIETYHENENN